jgi:hypothetical protein
MGDLEIRPAYVVSASLARPANPDQPPIPIKGSVTHVCFLRTAANNSLLTCHFVWIIICHEKPDRKIF